MTAANPQGLRVIIEQRETAWRHAAPEAENICRQAADAAVRAADAAASGTEVSIVLGDDALLRTLNRDWRGIDAPTNVLAFPCDGPDGGRPGTVLLGDVVVSYQTAAAEARRDGKAIGDHLAHLVVHGVLHLLGHDHQAEAEAELMEALETRILKELGIADPYGEPAQPSAGYAS